MAAYGAGPGALQVAPEGSAGTRLRVALVVPGGVDASGERRVIPVLLALIERLVRRHDVRVFALGQYAEPREYRLLGARVTNLGRPARFADLPGRTLWWRRRALARALDRESCAVVHAFWASEPGWLATAVAGRRGVPAVVSLAGGELGGLPEVPYGAQLSRRARWLVGGAMRRATVVTCASGPMERLAVAHGRRPVVVPLGVPRPAADRASAAPTGDAGTSVSHRLLFVGSLNRVKDPFTLLAALRLVVDAEPRVTLDVVGEDTLHGAAQRRAVELGLGPNVVFHGFLPHAALAPLYRSARLLLVTSRHEAGPVVALEAAHWGVPSVGSHVGHLADGAGTWAATTPPGDALRLARAVLALLRDPSRRERLGRAARAWALANDADATADRFEALYAAVLGWG